MEAKLNSIPVRDGQCHLRAAFLLILASSLAFGQTGEAKLSFEEYIKEGVPAKKDIDVFLNDACNANVII